MSLDWRHFRCYILCIERRKSMIEVGSLLKMKYGNTKWLALDEIADTVLVVNQKTHQKMWANKSSFEVIAWACLNVLTAAKSSAPSVELWVMSIVWSAASSTHKKPLSIGRNVQHHCTTRVPISTWEACKTHETRAGSWHSLDLTLRVVDVILYV